MDSPKKFNSTKLLNLDEIPFFFTKVDSSLGPLYLYDLRVSDCIDFEKIEENDPILKIRKFLINIASLEEAKKNKDSRKPLTHEEISRFSDVEIEKISEAYLDLLLGRVYPEIPPLPRDGVESSSAYLVRYIKHEIKSLWHRSEETKNKFFESINFFSKVRESSLALKETLSDFEKFKDASHAAAISNKISFSSPTEHLASQARERKEELELVRRTADMTAKSAKTLNELAIAASQLLEGLDERDKRSDRTTRIQLWIAVFSVILSTLFAFASLIFSGLAYYQDKENNIASDKWQSELLSQSQENNRQQKDIEIHNKNIQLSIDELKRNLSLSAQNARPNNAKKNQ